MYQTFWDTPETTLSIISQLKKKLKKLLNKVLGLSFTSFKDSDLILRIDLEVKVMQTQFMDEETKALKVYIISLKKTQGNGVKY